MSAGRVERVRRAVHMVGTLVAVVVLLLVGVVMARQSTRSQGTVTIVDPSGADERNAPSVPARPTGAGGTTSTTPASAPAPRSPSDVATAPPQAPAGAAVVPGAPFTSDGNSPSAPGPSHRRRRDHWRL